MQLDFKVFSPTFVNSGLIMLDICMDYTLPQFLSNFQDSCFLTCIRSRIENSVDSDQLASEKPADLTLHCFQDRISQYPRLAWQGLIGLMYCYNNL